jgi:hypothetical protein
MCNTTACGGRAGSRRIQNVVQQSTLEFVVPRRAAMLHDELENYRRGDVDARGPRAARRRSTSSNNWMVDFPKAYVIPVGAGQRSDVEANRLVRWLLFNDIEVTELKHDTTLRRPHVRQGLVRGLDDAAAAGLADTALSLRPEHLRRDRDPVRAAGVLEPRLPVGRGRRDRRPTAQAFRPADDADRRAEQARWRDRERPADGYTLEIDSPTAVRTLNALVRDGVHASLALTAFSGGAAGTAVFGGDQGHREGTQGRGPRERAGVPALDRRAAGHRTDREGARGSA